MNAGFYLYHSDFEVFKREAFPAVTPDGNNSSTYYELLSAKQQTSWLCFHWAIKANNVILIYFIRYHPRPGCVYLRQTLSVLLFIL